MPFNMAQFDATVDALTEFSGSVLATDGVDTIDSTMTDRIATAQQGVLPQLNDLAALVEQSGGPTVTYKNVDMTVPVFLRKIATLITAGPLSGTEAAQAGAILQSVRPTFAAI